MYLAANTLQGDFVLVSGYLPTRVFRQMASSRRISVLVLLLAALLVAGHLEARGKRLAGTGAPGIEEAQER